MRRGCDRGRPRQRFRDTDTELSLVLARGARHEEDAEYAGDDVMFIASISGPFISDGLRPCERAPVYSTLASLNDAMRSSCGQVRVFLKFFQRASLA